MQAQATSPIKYTPKTNSDRLLANLMEVKA
jgi:hypothetical protein